jgi:hypothetical protein
MPDDKFLAWVKRLANKGIAAPASFSYLKDAQHEALKRMLIQKNIIIKDEMNNLEEMVMEEYVDKIEKMPPIPR